MGDLLKQIEQLNDHDEFSRCIEAIEAIPENERGYKLTVLLGRAYSNLAVLGVPPPAPYPSLSSVLACTNSVLTIYPPHTKYE